jgi:DNA replication protein DnaC
MTQNEREKDSATPARLSAVLNRLTELQGGPEWQAARAADEQAAQEEQARFARERRAAVIAREHVPLTAEMERALIRDEGELRVTKSYETVRRWMARVDVPPVIVLAGAPGCGKSLAAAWVLAQRGGRWRSAGQIVRLFSGHYAAEVEEQESILRTPVLVIDDLGGELERDRMQSALLEILDARQRNARSFRTVITTNLNRAGLGKRYGGERLASRLKTVAWSDDRGPDLRGKR